MVYLAVLTSAPLLPLVTAYQEGVSQDVCILTRLGHDFSDGGDLGPVRAVMAPWLDRVGFRFIHELCPLLLLSYALEYGRVDLVRELMAMQKLCFSHHDWTLLYGAWSRCVCKHRHLQWQYTADIDGKVHDGNGAFPHRMRANGTSILGSVHHLAVAACLGDHVDLFRFAMDKDASMYLPNLADIALRGSKLCIASSPPSRPTTCGLQ
ncbi:hypothetical protein SPRG_16813 [Saprolegnia parasitica CBS 223.65]|uniref:Uncharacterized protein n=1 Tax=Saprolegnia parasitica (strain CBS 223.65) TaxID=695850 RepID=A0A067BTP0_SAPPC|nr:hypothetical protein SPRG_16813 [Saprolegnia parasitica CBS 223.65]KDO17641.1 hypothetical protein SPRG_16813 [Saprolegnia parasitica CBS 223.65]|eukprot:XP_012211652.1 hypothetical protein SPRG_16813 [Saprolegnia parasitica CBS 223.65]